MDELDLEKDLRFGRQSRKQNEEVEISILRVKVDTGKAILVEYSLDGEGEVVRQQWIPTSVVSKIIPQPDKTVKLTLEKWFCDRNGLEY